MLGRGLVVLVFHLEHNRNGLVAARVALTENEVSLGALGCMFIAFLGTWETPCMREQFAPVSQCCSSDSPTILVDRRTTLSARRSISSSL